jgi:hypothetical protein
MHAEQSRTAISASDVDREINRLKKVDWGLLCYICNFEEKTEDSSYLSN